MEDNNFYKQLREWQWVGPERFEVKPECRHDKLWKLAVKRSICGSSHAIGLERVEKVATPRDKMKCYAEAYNIAVDAIELYSKKNDTPGADDSTPVLFYLVLRSCPTHVFTTLK